MDNLARLLVERQMERDQATARMLEPAATCMPAHTTTEVNLADLHQLIQDLEAERKAERARLAAALDAALERHLRDGIFKYQPPPLPPPEPLRVITGVVDRLAIQSFA